MPKKKSIWREVLQVLQEHVNDQTYRTWFRETELEELEENRMRIHVPTQFIAQYLNKNYQTIISDICNTLYDRRYEVKFTNSVVKDSASDKNVSRDEVPEIYPRLNPKYKFKDFVMGANNRFARSAGEAVAQKPGLNYNPLFIYGDSGMGKTHLMHAIGHMVMELHEGKRVYYISTEQFTNDMIDGIRNNRMDKFRNKYRYFDVLLIDDIQFLSKREGTQEEFFHTFNALYENKKQIILTSDRPPRDIPDLEQRLVSRFEWGLLTDIKKPNYETRVAILKKKADRDELDLKDEVIQYMAENITSNVRALEGSLVKIQAWLGYKGIDTSEITIEMIDEILRDILSPESPHITLDQIRKEVCNLFNLKLDDLFLKTRKREIAFPRQIAMYLSNQYIPSLSLKDVAKYYKLKDHSTVIHAINSVKRQYDDKPAVKTQIDELREQLRN